MGLLNNGHDEGAYHLTKVATWRGSQQSTSRSSRRIIKRFQAKFKTQVGLQSKIRQKDADIASESSSIPGDIKLTSHRSDCQQKKQTNEPLKQIEA